MKLKKMTENHVKTISLEGGAKATSYMILEILYENYLICIFMNINENFHNERENLGKIKGCTYKMTNVSPNMCSSVSNLVPIKCLDIVLLP